MAPVTGGQCEHGITSLFQIHRTAYLDSIGLSDGYAILITVYGFFCDLNRKECFDRMVVHQREPTLLLLVFLNPLVEG